MKMRSHCTSWRATAPLLVVTIVLAGLAPVMKHRTDNMNDNALGAIWSDGAFGNVDVTNIDGRLEFHRKGAVPAAASAGILFNPHGINWKKNFHIEFDYRLSMNSIQPGRQFFMGAALAVDGEFPSTMTGLACGLLRDVGGLWVGALRFQNGNVIDFEGTQITQKTGTIAIDWNKMADRMYVGRVGSAGGQAWLDGYYADEGALYGNLPMALTFGIVSYNGSANFIGDNIYMDNLEWDYFSRAFP